MRTMLCLSVLMALAPASLGAKSVPVPMVLADQDRVATGGRPVRLILPQDDIETSIDLGRIASNAGGGGLIGALIVSSKDDRAKIMAQNQRDKVAEVVQPLRAALGDFDARAVALASTERALNGVAWFQPRGIVMTSDGAAWADNSDQFATVEYRYDLSPDFTQIRVVAEITLGRADKANGVGAPVYRQTVMSVVELAKRSYEERENVAAWSADNGARAEAALIAGFAEIERLIPLALGLTGADIAAFNAEGREKAFAAGLYGPLVERNGPEVVIWKGALISVQQAR